MYASRPLEESDLDTICTFPQNPEELRYFFPSASFPLTPDQLRDKVATRAQPTCIIYENEVVASANLYQIEADSCYLGNVIVAPAFRGRGAAAFLLETMISLVRAKYGVTVMKLICESSNTRGLLFYRKHGFLPVDLFGKQSASGEIVVGIRMERRIEEGICP
ncbi:acetyltransferase (GNAT) family protein [Paenibacillus taihuensis]|uniref:Acetyltransferase (GNAT) family protein n=1 Tax=Paenibacillus taihuensis TaxID=1156355 RepID=A0A3D9QWK5_9BACL|nr:GNAT family N-acetyltransferase [Paenibacillus taihuensis]REE69663.1 acetyltransferase (GNAT) family protein [Paenibacillus taihuensis]